MTCGPRKCWSDRKEVRHTCSSEIFVVFYLGAEDTVSLTREECKYLDFSLSIYSVQVSTARRAGLILIHRFPGRIRFFYF